MTESDILSKLTFCGDCAFWHPFSNAKMIKEEYRNYIGCCNKPYEGAVQRYRDDFCSCGKLRTNTVKENTQWLTT